MARSSARNVRPNLSDEPRDKMLAALNQACTKGGEGYGRAPMYFDACRQWYKALTPDQVDLVDTVCKTYNTPRAYGGEPVALDHAQDLPPAPRRPL